MPWDNLANKHIRLLALISIATLFLSACQPAPLPQTLKIGLVAPFEGRYRAIGYDAIYAARLAIREINAGGGVAGWRLELVAYDDRADPAMAQTAAQNLITDPEIIAIIGHYQQDSTAAAQSIYEAEALPLLVINAWLTNTQATTWHLAPPVDDMAKAMLAVASGANTEPISPVLIGEGPLAIAIEQELINRSGTLTPAQRNTTVFSTLPPVDSAEWLKGQSTAMFIGSPDYALRDFPLIGAEVTQGTHFVTPYPFPKDLPGAESWTTHYQSVGPHVPEPGPYALPTYEAIYLLAEALEIALANDVSPIQVALQASLSQVHIKGLLGEYNWDTKQFWQAPVIYHYRWDGLVPQLESSID
ncbi:MAG: ABC transporter substrate-binding protein [Anaerolineae bacterium]|nr:ABC transporter substrate-binding protein [Anaerolineae bacterium]